MGADALPWRETPYAGVHWKKLAFDAHVSSVLLRFEPGASYGAHRHPAGEQYLVLEGSLEDGGIDLKPGCRLVERKDFVALSR